jgi:hypothetical protein
MAFCVILSSNICLHSDTHSFYFEQNAEKCVLKGYCLSFCSNLKTMKNLSQIDFKVISNRNKQLFIPLFAFISKFNRNMI